MFPNNELRKLRKRKSRFPKRKIELNELKIGLPEEPVKLFESTERVERPSRESYEEHFGADRIPEPRPAFEPFSTRGVLPAEPLPALEQLGQYDQVEVRGAHRWGKLLRLSLIFAPALVLLFAALAIDGSINVGDSLIKSSLFVGLMLGAVALSGLILVFRRKA